MLVALHPAPRVAAAAGDVVAQREGAPGEWLRAAAVRGGLSAGTGSDAPELSRQADAALLAIPVRGADGGPLGVLCVVGDAGRAWTDADREALADAAGAAALALAAAREDEAEPLRIRDHAIAAVSSGVVIIDVRLPDQPIVFANPAFYAMTGYTPEEAIGRNCRFLQGPGTDRASVALIREAVRAGEPLTVEVRNHRRDGSPFMNRLSLAPVRDASGTVTHYVGIQTDVTAEHEARTALEHSEQYFRALFENAADVVDVVDGEGRVRFVSPSVERVLGYTPEQMVGTDSLDYVEPSRRAEIAEVLGGVMAQPGRGPVIQIPLLHSDGGVRVLEAQATNLLDHPAVRGIVVNARDITSRLRNEEALRIRDRALEAAQEAVLITGGAESGYAILYVNPAFERLTGYPAEEARGRNCRFLQGPGTDPATLDEIRAALAEERPCRVEVLNYRRDGSPFWNEVSITPVRGLDGRVAHYVGLQTDVTERRAFSTALAESESRFRSVVESLGEALVITDGAGLVTYANNRVHAVLGYPPGALIGRLAYEVLGHPEQTEEYLARAARRMEGESARYMARLRRADGTLAWTDVIATPLRDASGVPVGIVGALTDASARMRDERTLDGELRVLERLALGAPLSEVLHDIARVIDDADEGVRAAIFLAAGGEMRAAAAPSLPPAFLRSAERRGCCSPGADGSGRADPEGAALGLGACLAETIRSENGEMLGSVALYRADGAEISAGDRGAVARAARLAGIALQRHRAVESLQRQADALRESEEHFRSLIENASDLIVVVDSAGTIHYASPAFLPALGLDPGALPGQPVLALVHEGDRAGANRALSAALAAPGVPYEAEVRVRHADGTWRLFEVVGSARAQRDGERVVLNARDVTERRRAAAALHQSEERFRQLVDAVQDYSILLLDREGYVASWNAGAERMTGYRAEEVLGRHISLFYPAPSVEDGSPAADLEQAASQGRVEREGWRRRRDGTPFWMNTVLTALHDDAGRLTGFAEITRDLTERQAADEALRASEALLRSVLEEISDAITLKDLNGRYLLVNPAAARIVGVPAGQMLGHRLEELRGEPVAHRVAGSADRVIATGNAGTWEEAYDDRGRTRVISITQSPYHDASGALTGVLTVTRDITEQRVLEEQFRQSQKMEAVGRLAGGIAHDFNNILMAVGGHVQLLLRRTPEEDATRWSLEEIKKGADRAAALTRQLLAFSRRQVLRPTVLDVNDVVRGVIPMLERLIGEDVELVASLEPDLGTVRADSAQLEQVLMNLAVNARDAMPEGGVLVISTQTAALTERDHDQYRYVVPGRYLLLTVTDTGHGMDAQTVERIFEPFFTTKEAGRGTGLGLATVYGIVKQSGGYVWADSIPGRATTFRVYLPFTEMPQTVAEAPQPPLPPRRGAETVLLAEDEPAVRMLIGAVLGDAGYTVLSAANGAEALSVAAAHPGPIHLLVSDVVMPEMGGPELARLLRAARPGTRVLFLSGYTEDAVRQRLPEGGFVQKPVDPDELARRVRETLDESEAS
ncbi:MAG TPA: PAS domain S-box protein [Longimicrobium sp.]